MFRDAKGEKSKNIRQSKFNSLRNPEEKERLDTIFKQLHQLIFHIYLDSIPLYFCKDIDITISIELMKSFIDHSLFVLIYAVKILFTYL